MSETPFLTIEQAAERAQVSRNTIKKWISDGVYPKGALPVIRLSPRMIRIHVEIFDNWLVGTNTGTIQYHPASELYTEAGLKVLESMGYQR